MPLHRWIAAAQDWWTHLTDADRRAMEEMPGWFPVEAPAAPPLAPAAETRAPIPYQGFLYIGVALVSSVIGIAVFYFGGPDGGSRRGMVSASPAAAAGRESIPSPAGTAARSGSQSESTEVGASAPGPSRTPFPVPAFAPLNSASRRAREEPGPTVTVVDSPPAPGVQAMLPAAGPGRRSALPHNAPRRTSARAAARPQRIARSVASSSGAVRRPATHREWSTTAIRTAPLEIVRPDSDRIAERPAAPRANRFAGLGEDVSRMAREIRASPRVYAGPASNRGRAARSRPAPRERLDWNEYVWSGEVRLISDSDR